MQADPRGFVEQPQREPLVLQRVRFLKIIPFGEGQNRVPHGASCVGEVTYLYTDYREASIWVGERSKKRACLCLRTVLCFLSYQVVFLWQVMDERARLVESNA